VTRKKKERKKEKLGQQIVIQRNRGKFYHHPFLKFTETPSVKLKIQCLEKRERRFLFFKCAVQLHFLSLCASQCSDFSQKSNPTPFHFAVFSRLTPSLSSLSNRSKRRKRSLGLGARESLRQWRKH